jgi:hypothetical protein
MTDAEIREIAEAAAEAAVEKTLLRLGLDPEDSGAFAEWRKDYAYLRRLRIGSEIFKRQGLTTLASVLTTAIVGAALAALYRWFPHS